MSENPVVSPSVKTPGAYLSVDLKGAPPSPGTGGLRALIFASKISTGTITDDSAIEESVTSETIKTLLGTKAPGVFAHRRLAEEYPLAKVDVVSPAEPSGGTAATGVINFNDSSPVTVDRVVRSTIAGRVVETAWAAGETDQVAAERHRDAINALGDEMPVTASSATGTGWDLTLTFPLKGTLGNDVTVYSELVGGAGGALTDPATNKLTSGAGTPDTATAITTIANKEYDFIVNCCGNTEAQSGGSSSLPGETKTDIDLRNTGLNAKLQQQIVGVTDALASAKTGAGALNHDASQYVFCLNGQSLPWEFAGAECGSRMKAEEIRPNQNRIGRIYKARLYGAYDLTADTPTAVEIEDALSTGLSIVGYTASGEMYPVRPVTTYHKDALANPDTRVLDVGITSGLYAVAKDLRIFLPLEFPEKSLSPDLEPGDDPPPPDVVEERDIKAAINTRMRFWIRRGVIRRDKWETSVADGSFSVLVNSSDPTQADIVLPASVVRPLAKFGIDVRNGG